MIRPFSSTVSAGDLFTLTVEADSDGRMIQAADVFIRFDPGFLRVVDGAGQAAGGVVPVTDDLSMVLRNMVDNAEGLIAYAVMETQPYTPTQNLTLFAIPLRALWPTGSGGAPTELAFLFDQGTRQVTQLAVAGYDVLRRGRSGMVYIAPGEGLALPLAVKGRAGPPM